MTAFYLAARMSRRAEMRRYRKQLERAGHRVTSRWLDGSTDENAQTALRDCVDLQDADVCILFLEKPRTPTRAGRWFEFGLACGLDKLLITVGSERENIFCFLPDIENFRTWRECIAALSRKCVSLRGAWGPGIGLDTNLNAEAESSWKT